MRQDMMIVIVMLHIIGGIGVREQLGGGGAEVFCPNIFQRVRL